MPTFASPSPNLRLILTYQADKIGPKSPQDAHKAAKNCRKAAQDDPEVANDDPNATYLDKLVGGVLKFTPNRTTSWISFHLPLLLCDDDDGLAQRPCAPRCAESFLDRRVCGTARPFFLYVRVNS